MKMIFIDWISTPDHRNFNRAFFSALALKNLSCVVFSERLVIPEVECLLMSPCSGRVSQALRILKLVWKNRRESIALLTYDPLFVPIASMLKKDLLVFEHNTTPRKGLSKHLVWQVLFFGRIRRMAQFPAQHDRLLRIGNNTTYIGSPILPMKSLVETKKKPSMPFLFIAPSFRAVISELNRYDNLLGGATILVKKAVGTMSIETQNHQNFAIQYHDRIEFCHEGRRVDAVIITVQSRLRGTGWFNDSISNRTPIIITNPNTKVLFEESFPGYPFIALDNVEDSDQLEHLLDQVRIFDSMAYANSHNSHIRARFLDMCAALAIQAEC